VPKDVPVGEGWVRKECETPRFRHGLHEEVLSFAIDFERKADAGDIAAGAGERAHKTRTDHIAGDADDGNGPGRFLCGAHRRITGAKDNVRGRFGQRCRGFRKLLIAKPKAVDDDLQVLPLNEAQAPEFVKKRHIPRGLTSRAVYRPKFIGPSGLLRSRDMRPDERRCHRTSDEGNDFPPPHGFLPARGPRQIY
jgi:hypothetical protein